ncbi:MAG: uracil-DNA glycosylase [Candidatus Bathyarchaeia archaeon]
MSLPQSLQAREKSESMRNLHLEVQSCRRCGLWEGRRNPVLGEGSLDAKAFLVGEAPGRREDETGRPFAGAAGQLLNDLLGGIGLSRGDVYIGNVVKCRPPRNRPPRAEEVEACSPYLERQLSILRPRIIVSMGNTATQYLMTRFGLSPRYIGEVHGKSFRVEAPWGEVILLPSYHPASALYTKGLEYVLRRDFESLRSILDGLEASL